MLYFSKQYDYEKYDKVLKMAFAYLYGNVATLIKTEEPPGTVSKI
jgi:hypothetical protein